MLLTGHKSRAIFDRYNIINEQELLDAGDQLVAYLAQQAQAPRGRVHPTGAAAARTAPPYGATRRPRLANRRNKLGASGCSPVRLEFVVRPPQGCWVLANEATPTSGDSSFTVPGESGSILTGPGTGSDGGSTALRPGVTPMWSPSPWRTSSRESPGPCSRVGSPTAQGWRAPPS